MALAQQFGAAEGPFVQAIVSKLFPSRENDGAVRTFVATTRLFVETEGKKKRLFAR